MIKFFRKIRQKLLTENKFRQYTIYAIGEVLLVVVGILIALQINNWNDDRKERLREIDFLKNLKSDLKIEIENNNNFVIYHFDKAKACSTLLHSTVPKTKEDVQVYTDTYELVFMWSTFVPNNNTFKELLSSGNLSLIKNETIKNRLLELEKRHADIAGSEYHMRREYEEFLYDPHVKNVTALGYFDLTKPKFGFLDRLTTEDIPDSIHQKLIKDAEWQYNNHTFKNGLRLALMNNSYLAGLHKNLDSEIQELIHLINKDIEK